MLHLARRWILVVFPDPEYTRHGRFVYDRWKLGREIASSEGRQAMEVFRLACCLAGIVCGADPAIRSDQPNEFAFPPQRARFVRLVISRTSSSQPCIDELEVYGPQDAAGGDANLALAARGALASASSCLPNNPKHRIEHLNDGRYGNQYSWISAGSAEEWAQIELAEPAVVARVVFSRDRLREYADRVPVEFEVRLSTDGHEWTTVRKVSTTAAPVATRRRSSDFAGLVPPPPPPPRFAPDGSLSLASAPRPTEVARRDALGFPNLSLLPAARANASSLLPGYDIHRIEHLNDGLAGNTHSWISQADPSWAEIDLGDVYWIYKVALGSDDAGQYPDRAPATFSILTATDYDPKSDAPTWNVAHRHAGPEPVHRRSEFTFEPVRARWVRVAVETTNSNTVRIDELEVFGQSDPIPLEKIDPDKKAQLAASPLENDQLLRDAFLAEEHAWLKTHGRADLSPRLVPYNGRVKEYPHHVGDDRLPLPLLSSRPKFDGSLDDACWREASRGAVRVASPYDFDAGPLVTCDVAAGRTADDLFLAFSTDRLLSGHLAVVSTTSGKGCGAVAWTPDGLVFNTFQADAKTGQTVVATSRPLESAIGAALASCEVRLPLDWFPDAKAEGFRVGLGMGGKHTPDHGRPVYFIFSRLSIAPTEPIDEPTDGPIDGRTFRVRLSLPEDGGPLVVRTGIPPSAHAPDGNPTDTWTDQVTLAPSQSRILSLPAEQDPVGPRYDLSVEEPSGEIYRLHLFRYDPMEKPLSQMGQMLDRFQAAGLDVGVEREQWTQLRRRQQSFREQAKPDSAAIRAAFFEARLAKRRLFFREPELKPIQRILFVKRHAFEPSHNYSVNLDSRYRPGGGVYLLDIPRDNERFDPANGRLTELFASGGGIARNPMANSDLSKIYFAYRENEAGYYHLHQMEPDGGGVTQLTDGPFHDYWPCPLPGGALAFISTRCKSRYLCWRPQAAVLFRMRADGSDMRPLSFSNLSEWAPSVMTDGRIIWTRSEYIDKGADFSHTLWAMRSDGSKPELVFGNTIIQPNGYANGREVPGTHEICCTLISHFGDLNGPIALVDLDRGRFNPQAIRSITPEVPWPGMWPKEECFRDPLPIARDYFLCSHAPRGQFGIYVIDRFGNRELLYLDAAIGSMCPTPFRPAIEPPALYDRVEHQDPDGWGQFAVADVYRGIEPAVARGSVKYLRIVEEVRAGLEQMPNGEYRRDHDPFTHFYATPVDVVSGPNGWPSYVSKASWGTVPVEADGSAYFWAPAGKTLYFQVLDENYNELQRMRSVVQLQSGEQRSCIGCHEDRTSAPPVRPPTAMRRDPSRPLPPPGGPGPLVYQNVVQPVWDARCVQCHTAGDEHGIDLSSALDADRVPASYRTLISGGWIHYLDCGYNSGGNEKRPPLTFGTLQSKLWELLDAGHYDVHLTTDEMRRVKLWTDLNCPLWGDYQERTKRPMQP
jgi:hypothetical protein